MSKFYTVAVLGSTGYIGIELVKKLINHPNVKINFLGTENSSNEDLSNLDSSIPNTQIPKLTLNSNFDPDKSDIVFLALPHGISHKYVKKFFNKIKIIDLSADFRLDSEKIYFKNYQTKHSCPNIINEFVYGLPEINRDLIKKSNNIAVPGCYPTSILLPLIPLIKNNIIDTNNIIVDSKSGFSGAGKKFEINNIKNLEDYNFYNYNTNTHRHICEIQQELNKVSNKLVNFSFNPHILPVFRGMMTTIYCDLKDGIELQLIEDTLNSFYINSTFVNLLDSNTRGDFFLVQKTNNCFIKIYKHNKNKLIIVSIIDNLLKGGAGQAVQCLNLLVGIDESISLIN
tara:strand:+ start:424 stop:1449 length:1026 start_codon:yes stop_codon:yes gene_type:complete